MIYLPIIASSNSEHEFVSILSISVQVLPKLQEVEDVTDPMSLFLKQLDGEKENTDISVLVASLQSRYYDEIKDLYAANPNSENRVIRFHMVSHLVSHTL